MSIDVSEQTKNELEQKKQIEFIEWNKKINEITKDIIDLLQGHRLTTHDFSEIVKLLQQTVGNAVGQVEINYVLSKVEEKKTK